MDPFTIAGLIGGGLSGLGALFGGSSESKAIRANNAFQREAYEDAKKGATDARGTRTYFDEELGWITEYGPTDQYLEDYRMSTELPALQRQFLESARMSGEQFSTADALLDEFRRIERQDPAQIEQLLLAAASEGIGEGTRDATETAMRSILRTGSTGGSNILRDIAQGGQEALSKAGIQAKLQALDYADSKYKADRADTTNLFNSFLSGGRASLHPTTSANTSPTVGVVGSDQAAVPRIQADTGMANALGGVGAAIGGIGNIFGAQQQRQQTNDLLASFLNAGGGFNMGTGGIFGSVNDRMRNTGSSF